MNSIHEQKSGNPGGAGRLPTILWALFPVLLLLGLCLSTAVFNRVLAGHENSATGHTARIQEFSFARLVYTGNGYGGWPRWQADWPDAELHFSDGLSRLTKISVSTEDKLVQLDQQIFDYPWVYAVEVGALTLSEQEAALLREYLERGGFLMVDDFHGPAQWRRFEAAMQQVFPDRRIIDLTDDHEAFNLLYDLADAIGQRRQVPGIRAVFAGKTWEYGGNTPHWRGILDAQGRLMVLINFNMDLGDAWEHADEAGYPLPYTALAYRMGVNYVVYSLTH